MNNYFCAKSRPLRTDHQLVQVPNRSGDVAGIGGFGGHGGERHAGHCGRRPQLGSNQRGGLHATDGANVSSSGLLIGKGRQ